MAEIQNLIYKSECVLNRIRTLLYTKFTEENKIEVENKVKASLEEYCHLLILLGKDKLFFSKDDCIFLDEIFNDIFAECRKLLKIYQRQKVIEKFHLIKQKFLKLSTTDTSRDYIKDLEKEAEELRKELQENKYAKLYCLDLWYKLEVLINRIKRAKKDINIQFGMELATGFLTLGSAVATGAVGIAGIVARTGGAVVGGAATAADDVASAAGSVASGVGGAVKGVSKTVKVASAAVNVIDDAAPALASKFVVKVALKSLDLASGGVTVAAKATDCLLKAKIESKEREVKKTSEELCFCVSKKVLHLQDAFVEDPYFCSTVLAIAIFEHLMNI